MEERGVGSRRVQSGDTKLHFERDFPEDLVDLLAPLWQEAVSVHASWVIFKQLFTSGQKRRDILKETAVSFFGVVHAALHERVMLGVARLGDPATTGQGESEKENASLEALLKQIEQRGDSKLVRTLRRELDGLRACSGGIRKWRNRRIAHTDLPTALLLHPDPLPGIQRELVDEALERVRNFMNEVEKHYADSETEYEHVIQPGGGEALLVWLKAGLAHEDEERKKHGLPPRYAALLSD